VFGRSIGSGLATYLAANRNPAVLVLMSAFTSIRGVVKDLAGCLTAKIFKERFDNANLIKNVKSSIFLIHG
jgi:hypothetical protein